MQKLRVLVVDDSKMARSILVRLLQQCGCEVVGLASNGFEAVDMYKANVPDLVTLDLMMPDMDGHLALRSIRQYDPVANVIIVSSMGRKEEVLKCVKEGAKNFIIKPFDKETLLTKLTEMFPEHYEQEESILR